MLLFSTIKLIYLFNIMKIIIIILFIILFMLIKFKFIEFFFSSDGGVKKGYWDRLYKRLAKQAQFNVKDTGKYMLFKCRDIDFIKQPHIKKHRCIKHPGCKYNLNCDNKRYRKMVDEVDYEPQLSEDIEEKTTQIKYQRRLKIMKEHPRKPEETYREYEIRIKSLLDALPEIDSEDDVDISVKTKRYKYLKCCYDKDDKDYDVDGEIDDEYIDRDYILPKNIKKLVEKTQRNQHKQCGVYKRNLKYAKKRLIELEKEKDILKKSVGYSKNFCTLNEFCQYNNNTNDCVKKKIYN